MSDYIVRATAANGQIRAFASTTCDLVEKARQIHNTSPVGTAALGRLLTAAGMMGCMMKGDNDLLSIIINADGPMGKTGVTANANADVKGYISNPDFQNPPNYFGKLDVGGAIGNGTLKVIKDLGLKEPYIGTTGLLTGEIAEDLTYYFATSEQVPTSVALGVLMNHDNTVKQAGGFIIQLMPFAEDVVIDKLEERIKEITSITSLLDQGLSPEQILEQVLGDFDIEFNGTLPTRYHCNCNHERVSKVLLSVGKKELESMIADGKPIEVNCHFCNTNHVFSIEELKMLLKKAK
ncbi:MAG: Hsp33 family molecular chaperone HslO [Lachnospiraceae bacterium]|nr:Hsp33 family molecular chaperone HslO [Lachnospiraceae bacterium]